MRSELVPQREALEEVEDKADFLPLHDEIESLEHARMVDAPTGVELPHETRSALRRGLAEDLDGDVAPLLRVARRPHRT